MVARKEKLRRADLEFRRLLDERQKTTPSPHLESDDTPVSQSSELKMVKVRGTAEGFEIVED